MRRLFLLLVPLAGCLPMKIDAHTSRDDDISLDLSQAVGPCDGVIMSGDTTITFTLSADQKTCNAHFDIAGSFLSVSDLIQDYKDEVDGYPDTTTVSITAMHADVTNVVLVDSDGAKLDEPIVTAWSASVSVVGAPVVNLSGTTAASLFGGVMNIDLAAAVDPLNKAVDTNGTLPTSGHVDVAMDVDSLAAVVSGHTGALLNLTVTAHLDLKVSTHLYDQL